MFRRFTAVLFLTAVCVCAVFAVMPFRKAPVAKTRAAVSALSLQGPITFEQNISAGSETFVARSTNYELSLSPTEAILAPYFRAQGSRSAERPPKAIRMGFAGANQNAKLEGVDRSAAVSNYFIGNDPKQWRVGVPRYRTVRVNNLYDGIDLIYYGKNGELEHDLVVAPGKSPASIKLAFSDNVGLKLDGNGDLLARTESGELRLKKPKIYQKNGNTLEAVDGVYNLQDSNLVALTVGKYDRSRSLVIDPVLIFSTFLGEASGAAIESVAVDSSGNIYVVGSAGTAFPLKNPLQPNPSPGVCPTPPCAANFVTKFDPTGSALIFSTYFGGTTTDQNAVSVAVDANQNVYVAGNTAASDFPTTPGAFSTTFVAGPCLGFTCREAFVAKFDSSGAALAYSTYLGSVGDTAIELPRSLAVDSLGHAFVTGTTASASFPTTAGSFQPVCKLTVEMECNTAFVSVLNQTGSALVYSTYLGGSGGESGNTIAVNSAGSAFVSGVTTSSDFPLKNPLQTQQSQGFFTKLTPDGSGLLFSSYFGGSAQVNPTSVALDANENIYIAGWTDGDDYPTTPGAFLTTFPPALINGTLGFVTKIDSSGASFSYSSYLFGATTGTGINTLSFPEDIAVDNLGQAYVTGYTTQAGWPQVNPVLPDFVGGSCTAPGDSLCTHAFVTAFNAQGSALVFSTYLGGMNADAGTSLAVDQSQSIYAVGATNSPDFPATANAFQPTFPGGTCGSGPCAVGYLTKMQFVPLTATPTALSFSQNVGSTSAPQNVTITNSSTQAIPITSVSISTAFSQTNTCSTQIPAGGMCVVSVSFSPSATGPATGSLTINYTGMGGALSVSLTGIGTQPMPVLAPTSLQFGSQAIGSPSAAQPVTLTNQGTGPLNISGISVSGDFSQTNTCVGSLAAGANCSISAVFTPLAAGVRNGQISISDDASGSPHSVPLTGTGTGPTSVLTPSSVQFSPQVVGTISAAQIVTFMNGGNSALTISSVSVSGDFGQTNTCGATLAAGANCAISVTFSPVGVGSRTGTLTVTDNSFGSPHSVPLTGSGVGLTIGPSAGAPATLTVAAGTPAIYMLQVQGVAGFSGTVGLSANCGSVPLNTSCALSASSVQLSGATPATFTLTVGTTAKSRLTPLFNEGPGSGERQTFEFASGFICTLFILVLSSMRRQQWTRRSLAGIALVAGSVVLGSLMVGCSGGGGGGGSPGTTPGTYTVTVTGSSQGASQTQTLTLVVQ